MDIKKEIVDAIQILVDAAIRKTCPVISFGIVSGVGTKGKCTVKINNVDQNISYYGKEIPTINQKYPVFVPMNNMSLAFILTTGGGGGGTGGTSNYDELSNRPAINNVTLSGNKTSGQLGLEPSISSGTTEQYWRGDKTWQNLNKSTVGLSNVDNVKQYSASNPPPYPVQSVNGKNGNVELTYSDVNALSENTVIPEKTSELTNDSGFITASEAPVQSVNGQTGNVTVTGADSVYVGDDEPTSDEAIIWIDPDEEAGNGQGFYLEVEDHTIKQTAEPRIPPQGFVLPIEKGGTGANNATDARANLGLGNVAIVAYGTCSTAGNVANKEVAIASTQRFELAVGAIIGVKFTASNSASNVTLNVNGTGAKSIWYNNAIYTSSTISVCGYANRTTFYMFDGTYWVWLNCGSLDGNTIPASYCTTAAGTAAKTASHSNYVLLAKSYTLVTIGNSNTSASALTLNINSKGAKPIYINGTASSASNYTLPAGTYLVYYDGTNYYFRTDGQIISTAAIADSAVTANKLASDAVTASHIETALGFKPLPVSNHNLLDNWWFESGVINQRGQTVYTGISNSYTIDRWKALYTSLRAEIVNGGMRLSTTSTGTDPFRQILATPIHAGETITLSILFSTDDTAINGAFRFVDSSGAARYFITIPSGVDRQLRSISVTSEYELIGVDIRIPNNGSITVHAVKLEYGTVSTLANDHAPDERMERAKCQAYFIRLDVKQVPYGMFALGFAASTNIVRATIPIPVTMRARPAVSYGGKIAVTSTSGARQEITGISVHGYSADHITLDFRGEGLTQNAIYDIHAYNDATAYIDLSSNL